MGKNKLLSRMAAGLGIIYGWRAIGCQIGRSARTARRWYDKYHLPVRYAPNGRPFGLIDELNVYMIEYARLVSENEKIREANHQRASMMRSHKRGNKKP